MSNVNNKTYDKQIKENFTIAFGNHLCDAG